MAIPLHDEWLRRIAVTRSNATLGAQAVTLYAAELVLCVNVLCDLRSQGWKLQIRATGLFATAPSRKTRPVEEQKAFVRAGHLVERDAQLRESATRHFIGEMERQRYFRGKWVSIFSLMRDGRELAPRLKAAQSMPAEERAGYLKTVIDPYVVVVTPKSTCPTTGIELQSIWRYFRHTWATSYLSTPGRKLFVLIRDRAAAGHPVVGIAALGSSVVQLQVRDDWIGWSSRQFIADLRKNPTIKMARWLHVSLDALLRDVYVADLLREKVITRAQLVSPAQETVDTLLVFAKREREIHSLYPKRARHKELGSGSKANWRDLAHMHLFRSKRAHALAALLRARLELDRAGFVKPSVRNLALALNDRRGLLAIQTVLRHMRAVRVGANMMEITVCGAVSPYNHALGGKLAALAAASPAVTRAYLKRYRASSSVIASGMAGRSVRRGAGLVLLGTTSLYGVGASQYNRLRVPRETVRGSRGDLAYIPIGMTAGYGSYHFSRETLRAIDVILRRGAYGRRVNSIFGEGVSPKLRKVREALDLVGLPSDALLQHGTPRLIYVVPLAENFRDILLGLARRPRYLVPQDDSGTADIIEFWRRRWLVPRVARLETIEAVEKESMAGPVGHGARVDLPARDEDFGPLFDVISAAGEG